jgi:hypothetical protein
MKKKNHVKSFDLSQLFWTMGYQNFAYTLHDSEHDDATHKRSGFSSLYQRVMGSFASFLQESSEEAVYGRRQYHSTLAISTHVH